MPSNSVSATKLSSILGLGLVLTDKSHLSKMRDEFAVGLFNFKNALILLKSYTKESFFFIFVTALWVESILNDNLLPSSRIYLINILLKIYECLYENLKYKKLPDQVSFKKSIHNEFVTICTIEKIERIFPTLLATRYEMCKDMNTRIIAINRLSTHTVENKIGNIRSQSHKGQGVEKDEDLAEEYNNRAKA